MGAQKLSKRLQSELLKDEMIITQEEEDKVVWHFFRNANNGNMGPNKALRDALQKLKEKYPGKFDFHIYDGNS
jgi:CHAT domain-containing protein